MFGEATAQSRRQTLCNSKVNSKKINCCKSRRAGVPVSHSWRRQCCMYKFVVVVRSQALRVCVRACVCVCVVSRSLSKGATTGGLGDPDPPPKKKSWTDHPNFLRSSARNWVYHPYFVLYNNLDQGIGPPTLKTWLRPCQ